MALAVGACGPGTNSGAGSSGGPPGVVIDFSAAETGVYIGSPSIAVTPDGAYVASHDLFGPGSTEDRTAVFRSDDRGRSWRRVADLSGQWWSSLFVHRGKLYILGTSRHSGDVVIRRSEDGGVSWTTPVDAASGLLLAGGKYHCAPVPVVEHAGRLWRAFEDKSGEEGWPEEFQAFVLSAPVDADLLRADSWIATNRLRFDPAWLEAEDPGWLEGNVVVLPNRDLANVLRLNDDQGDRAAIAQISADGARLSFDPETGIVDLPGGRAKFTIRYDERSGRYWTLANKQRDPDAYRNVLVLASSPNVRDWTVHWAALRHPDPEFHAFQYVDWLFDGDDLIAVSRTAWGGAHRAHDANYLTFFRIPDFREKTERDPPLE